MNNYVSNKRTQLFVSASTAILATAIMASPAQAQSIVTAQDRTSVLEANVTAGDGAAQTNTGAVTATNQDFVATTANTGVAVNGAFENNENTADATATANRNGVTASLATIGSSTSPDDGVALSAVSVNTGATASVDAVNSSALISTTLSDFSTGSVDVSNNTISSSVVINDGSDTVAMEINGSEPVDYANLATTNAAVTTDLSLEAASIADLAGTLLVSSVQVAGATADSSAQTTGSLIRLAITTTEDAAVNGTATLDGNSVAATFSANDRTASIGLAADDASTSVTAAISNAQSFLANTADAAASSSGNNVQASITDSTGTITTSFANSSLSVSSNAIEAVANGNTATTQITLADGLSFNTVADNTATATIDELADNAGTTVKLADVSASGGLVGVNTQIVTHATETGDILQASSDDNSVDLDVASLESSTIDVSSNRLTTAATGNDLTANIESGDASAVFDASAVLASRQQLNNVAVDATNSNADVFIDVGQDGASATFVNSTITAANNVLAASATGNRARQTIALEATTVNGTDNSSAILIVDPSPALVDNGLPDALASASGAVVIASAMVNNGSAVSAQNTISDIDIQTADILSGTAANTSVVVNNNVQQAFAVGSDAGNSLSLMGTTVGSGAGISNLQINDATSTVSSAQDSSIDVAFAADLTSGSAEISGNNASAIARGTVADNTLAVDAEIVALGDNGGVTAARPTSLDASVIAAFGIANVQQVQANVTAESFPDDTNVFRMDVLGGLTDANTLVNANTLMAQAQGTVANNALSLDVGTLTSVESLGDATIANLQNVTGADILATINGNSNAVIETEIDNTIVRSSVETSGNRVMATAESARANNAVSVSGTSLSGSERANFSEAVPGGDVNQVNGQFGVANTQVAGTGNVIASLRDTSTGSFMDSSAVVSDINADVTSSSIESNGNLLQALASSNRATNSVGVDGTTLTQVGTGLANSQVSAQDVSAQIGFAGLGDVEAFSVESTVTTGVAQGSLSALNADQITAFLLEFGGEPNFAFDRGTGDFSFDSAGDGALTLPVPGTTGTFNSGGVLIDLEGITTSSTIAVNGNAVQGSAIGNSAANSVSVASTSADGSTAVGATQVRNAFATVIADTSLASTQNLLADSSSATEVFTTFAIDGALDTAISDSALSVSGNSQLAEAIGNTQTNNLTVMGTDLAGTATSGALSASQNGNTAQISAVSDMEVAANVVSSGSTVDLDQNSNSALGVVNNATNTLMASSTNSTESVQATGTTTTRIDSTGSFTLANGQQASGSLNSSATTNVTNIGATDSTTTGVINGSVSMANNATRSESTVNRAANTLSVAAQANLGSSASLVNQQLSTTAATSNATSDIALGVSGTSTTSEALDTSFASVEGNTTLALARGNSASNTLNFTAGAAFTATAGAATVSASGANVTASAALFNEQSNTGAVTANATGRTSIALNATNTATDAGVLNSNVNNSNNSTTAFAVGNTAANTVMLSSLNTGMPNIALGNRQTNSGAVSAVTTSVTFSVNSVGTFGGSSFVNNGNAGSATAIGNSSVSVIGAQ